MPGATLYARICGATLARAHARWGDRIAIASYLGKGDGFDRAIADFASAYADQNERDYAAFVDAVDSGDSSPRPACRAGFARPFAQLGNAVPDVFAFHVLSSQRGRRFVSCRSYPTDRAVAAGTVARDEVRSPIHSDPVPGVVEHAVPANLGRRGAVVHPDPAASVDAVRAGCE